MLIHQIIIKQVQIHHLQIQVKNHQHLVNLLHLVVQQRLLHQQNHQEHGREYQVMKHKYLA